MSQNFWQHMNKLPVALRKKTTPELFKRHQDLLQTKEIKDALSKQPVSMKEGRLKAESHPIYFQIMDHTYFSTIDGTYLFDKSGAMRMLSDLCTKHLSSYANQIMTLWDGTKWVTFKEHYAKETV